MGTNLALLHFMWMLVTGMLLPYRGALFPALQAIGLSAAGVRRAWAAFRYGAWDIATLLSDWERYVAEQGQWQPNRYEGYVPKAVDLTAFWRPRLQGCQTKHFYPHVVFLGARAHRYDSLDELRAALARAGAMPDLVFVKDVGVFVTETFSKSQSAQLRCYFDVRVRQPEGAKLDPLPDAQVADLLVSEDEKHRMRLSSRDASPVSPG